MAKTASAREGLEMKHAMNQPEKRLNIGSFAPTSNVSSTFRLACLKKNKGQDFQKQLTSLGKFSNHVWCFVQQSIIGQNIA